MLRRALRLQRSNRIVAAHAGITRSALERALGFMFFTHIGSDDARYFAGCTALHSWFVFTPIDIVFVDEHLRITEIRPRVAPFTPVIAARSGSGAIELAPGRAAACGLTVGDMLTLE